MGVYAFSGLNPPMTVDMSYAYAYDKEARSFWLDFTPQSVTVAAEATGSAFEGEVARGKYAATAPSPKYLPGWYIIKQFALLRYRVQFTFDEANKVATIHSCIGGCWSPLSWAYNAALGETLEKRGGGVWARENYVSLANRTAAGRLSGYELLPVLLPGGKVDARGLKYAQGKLEAANATLKGAVLS